MNHEDPDEIDAKRVVQRVLGIQLEHADKYGGVDYRSLDGRIAVEVTRVTAGDRLKSRKAINKSVKKQTRTAPLSMCWVATPPETGVRLDSFVQTVQPALAQLEAAGVHDFDRERDAVEVILHNTGTQHSPIVEPLMVLLNAGAETAAAVPHQEYADDPNHEHRLHYGLVSPYTHQGSDDALARILAELQEKTDNPKKLAESGAEARHLFVWVDGDTDREISRALHGEAPSWVYDDSYGTPSTAPDLDPAITHLWVVHEGTRQGWVWDGESWQGLKDV
ncbi:hypothetical protein K0817_013945 [Microbacterium sp. HD4P20]|uniref:hypothetical protein n=1 Tax=Microbacterium sp. HD4P20 TaxID=2864874 RepID=UPI001C642828|nr:hypothetical protein [Microbacterium sp. HD4P20]MCP2637657.1 hypothetical protein [Microbacterium sp. HD4P20]